MRSEYSEGNFTYLHGIAGVFVDAINPAEEDVHLNYICTFSYETRLVYCSIRHDISCL